MTVYPAATSNAHLCGLCGQPLVELGRSVDTCEECGHTGEYVTLECDCRHHSNGAAWRYISGPLHWH